MKVKRKKKGNVIFTKEKKTISMGKAIPVQRFDLRPADI